MSLKTAYRPKKPEIKSEIPAEKELPTETIVAPPETPAVTAEVIGVIEPGKTEPSSDASIALKRQLEAQQQAEQLRLQAAQAALQQQPMTREQRLALWKQNGLSDTELHFLKEHPEMIDHPALTNQAATEAMQAGHERNSEPYWKATKMNFDAHLNRLQQQATVNPVTQPTPAFFQPPPPPAPPTRSHMVSAPVSREVPGSRAPDVIPGRVHLSTEELEVARAAGISATRYAEGKIELAKQKARGERQ